MVCFRYAIVNTLHKGESKDDDDDDDDDNNNNVAGYIHWMICKHTGLQVTDKYYKHIPERVINVNGTTLIWNIPVITDRTMLANRPNIVLLDKKEKACLLINTAIPTI